LNDLSDAERDFLERHVQELRGRHADPSGVFCKFSRASTTEADLEEALTAPDDRFVEIATTMVAALAATTRAAPKAAEICVLALVTSSDVGTGIPTTTTFLKLDARTEAAKLVQNTAQKGIRLEVYKDLLPAPGEMQKGFSWPDPRGAESDVIFFDKNTGEAAKYFPNAFLLSVSPSAAETEKYLVRELVHSLGPADAQRAVALVDQQGGRADSVVSSISEVYDRFQPEGRPVGGDGSTPGRVRPNQLGMHSLEYKADGIVLRVPVNRLNAIQGSVEGNEYVTIIRTSVPLFPG
jgi:hypothetical protein